MIVRQDCLLVLNFIATIQIARVDEVINLDLNPSPNQRIGLEVADGNLVGKGWLQAHDDLLRPWAILWEL